MLMGVKNTINFFILSLKYNIKSSLEYKKSFIVQSIFMILNNGFFLIFWAVVFQTNEGQINGIEMNDILYLWSLPVASWGIANFFFGGFREINRYVLTGGLDTYILQPKNMLLNLATSKCDFGAFGDMMYGLVVGWIACGGSIWQYTQLLFYTILGTIITCATFVMVRIISIWLGEIEQVAHIYENTLLITLCNYPFEIFGGFMKFIMFTVVPAAYISHLPIKLLGKFDGRIFLWICLMTVVYTMMAIIIFYQSLKRYESGNHIAMKE